MQVPSITLRHFSFFQISFTIFMCCMVLFFSGCTDSLAGTAAAPYPTPGLATPTDRLAQAKSDSNGTMTEAISRTDLADAQRIMAGMSLDQKLGQLIIVEYLGTSYQNSGLQYMISQQFVGGFMYQKINNNFDPPYNVESQVASFSQQAMQDAKIPLMIATDQEGGQVNRLYTFHGALPSAATMAATGDPNVALTQATQAAKWLLALGINADLAPVVDVGAASNLLEDRTFSSDPETVATYAGAFLNGLQHYAVAGCLKHFPGLGSLPSNADPHFLLPTVNRSMADLENTDFLPYKRLIQEDDPAMIMSTDVISNAIDPNLPAELSPKAIDGVLRKELGYNGVVITDGLYMNGIKATWPIGQASVLAIAAGNDLVEGPYTPDQVAEVIAALKTAIQQGQLSIDRINQSVERILLLKARFGIIK